ncbi:hypothetical protein [uncultured Clostridium sp.]|uniref:hypothetical protein n=1 Tax=uncultured Clostridium sp. TaxID=59620 RepID=UPI0025830957|nr:hypothetical protein [uncultured Clostridium sp.]
MKLLELKNGITVDDSEVKELSINNERKNYNKKVLFDSLKELKRVNIILHDGTVIKDTDVSNFCLVSF